MKTDLTKIAAIILAGPVLASLLSLLNITLAPPYQGFAPLLYIPICTLGFPVCVVLAFQKKLLGWKLLAGFALAFIVPIVLFILTNPTWMPSGMSSCKQVDSSQLAVKYECVDSSSDDSSYHREFFVDGFKGWPIMWVVEK